MNAEKGAETTGSLVGKVLNERFRVIAPIARGGMGAVYKAEQAPLGRLVALKVLSPKHDPAKDPGFRKRFLLEAATVAKLSHPNTVTVFDYGESEGLYFIVMELLEGPTLRAVLKRDGAFDAARTLHIARQMCRSLREAHRLGIVHRDMKPGNVVLLDTGDEQDYVKVLDFGLVKDIEAPDDEDLTQAGVFMGSPKYMSPEQIRGEPVDGRSDIYSVGVLMYEMLCGAPPFSRDQQVQVLMDHIHAPVPPLPPSVPIELARVVERCLAKAPEARFADMDGLLTALHGVAHELALTTSDELALSGEHRTSISGVHTRSSETTQSGSISAPVVSSPSITPSTVSLSGAVATPVRRPRRGAVFGLAALGLGLAGAIALVALDPFEEPPTVTAPPPSPTLVATPTPVVAPPPVVAPRSLLVELDSQPAGATVHLGDAEYGPTPAQIELTGADAEPGAELTFTFSLAGHRETTVVRAVPADGPLTVDARLRRIPRAPRPGASQPRETPRAEPGAQTVTPAGYRESPY